MVAAGEVVVWTGKIPAQPVVQGQIRPQTIGILKVQRPGPLQLVKVVSQEFC